MRPPTEHLTHPKYRPDIDGLRAIAVLSVVAYHAFPPGMKGGFLGVDIFFVISGFLIPTIIFTSLDTNGFDFVEFYSRRIKRIFPALAVVLVASYCFGWAALLPDEFEQLGRHIAGGAGFVSNFVLWGESGYFDKAAETKPLLHLWSLGIEEQFYILWPLLLWLVWRRRFNLLAITLAIAAASFLLNVARIHDDPVGVFYLPHARLWELLIGSILAYLSLYGTTAFAGARARVAGRLDRTLDAGRPPGVGPHWGPFASWTGVAALGAGFAALSNTRAFPGWWALLPTLGAFLVISAGPHAWFNRVVLANRVLVWIGLISFPLYLWHWPILSFARILESRTPSIDIRVGAVLASIALAWVTYRFVERPLRFGGNGRANTVLLLVSMLIIGLVGYGNAIEPLSARFGVGKIVKAAGEWDFPGTDYVRKDFEGRPYFVLGSRHPSETLYIGDSNMEHYWPRIKELTKSRPAQTNTAVFMTHGGCPPIHNVAGDGEGHDRCKGFSETALKYALTNGNVDTVVVGAQWFGYLGGSNYFYQDGDTKHYLKPGGEGNALALAKLQEMLATLKGANKRVFLVLNSPIGASLDPKGMIQRSFGHFAIRHQEIRLDDFLATYGGIRTDLRLLGERAGVSVIDPLPFLCNETSCSAVTADGTPMYKDGHHLRPGYVREQVRFLDDTLALRPAT